MGGSVVYLLLHTRHDSATAGDSPLEATLSICCDCHLSRQLRCTNAELPLHSQGFTSGSSPSSRQYRHASSLEATLSICCDCHLSGQLRCTNAELQGFTSGSSPSLYGECMKKRRFVVLSEAQLAGNSAS